MKKNDRYDSLIHWYCQTIFPEIDWRLIKAQIEQESFYNPTALSSANCMGLMQISPALAKRWLQHPQMVWCADVNIKLGITYLKEQYDHFPEISDYWNRVLFALASYNCGRGYVNLALRIARQREGKNIKEPGIWQTWTHTKQWLTSPCCRWRNKTPMWRQTLNYVEKIEIRFQRMICKNLQRGERE